MSTLNLANVMYVEVNLKFTMHYNESECRFFVVLNFYSIKQTAALIRISFERRKFP